MPVAWITHKKCRRHFLCWSFRFCETGLFGCLGKFCCHWVNFANFRENCQGVAITHAKSNHKGIVLEDPPLKRMFGGFDNFGRALEIAAVEDDEEDCLVVLHAMKMRPQYYFLLEGD